MRKRMVLISHNALENAGVKTVQPTGRFDVWKEKEAGYSYTAVI